MMKCLKMIGISLFTMFIFGIGFNGWISHADTADAYDLSQWQQTLSDSQVAKLKQEVKFLILRVQYGTSYKDPVFSQNMQKIRAANIPYGVYSYSRYTNNAMAQSEAKQLYQLAPNARFYVNDIEEQTTSNDQLVAATQSWAQAMHQMTSRPVVLYSYQSMLDNQLASARSSYDAIWIANYTSGEPNPAYHYDLWQFTDKFPSAALNQNVDASVIPSGGRSLLNLKPIGKSTTVKQSAVGTSMKKHNVKPTVKKTKQVNYTSTSKNYYDDQSTVFVQVINPSGIDLYSATTHKKVHHIAYGRYLLVNQWFTYNGKHYGLGANNRYYSASKSAIAPITNPTTLKELHKTLK